MKRISNTANNEIHKNINIVRERIAQPGNILTKEERKTISEEVYKLEKQERFTKKTKKKSTHLSYELSTHS